MKTCSKCANKADVYAGGKYAGDWADYYCNDHIPNGFTIWDRFA